MHPYDWAFRFGGHIGLEELKLRLEDLELQWNIQQNKFGREEIEDTIKLIESGNFGDMLREELDDGTIEGTEGQLPQRTLLWRIIGRYVLLRNRY